MFSPCHVVRSRVYKESVLFSFTILYKFLNYEIQKKKTEQKCLYIKARYNKEIRNKNT